MRGLDVTEHRLWFVDNTKHHAKSDHVQETEPSFTNRIIPFCDWHADEYMSAIMINMFILGA